MSKYLEREICLMSKIFNVNADCKPNLHYMVDIENRLNEIKILVDKGEYFVINRARQYGKTTTLRALSRFLQKDYIVVNLDFQKQMSGAKYENEKVFSVAFSKAFLKMFQSYRADFSESMDEKLKMLKSAASDGKDELELVELFEYLSDICAVSEKPVILMIDEVDSAVNNQVFLDFLAQLRGYYIDRDVTPTFWSVILAGVYDIKNLKGKIQIDGEHRTNSPWNIAAEFNVNMSFTKADIAGMLTEYDKDYKIGMDIDLIAGLVFDYTSGYPFLVSRICKIIDEKIVGNEGYADRIAAWTKVGFLEAVKRLLLEKNTLFESLMNKLNDYPELSEVLYSLLFTGKSIVYNPDNYAIDVAIMFGFVKMERGNVIVANRIFETRIYNMFLSSNEMQGSDIYKAALQDKNQFIQDGHLNMNLVMQKFTTHFNDLFGDKGEKFIEEDGRRYFLLYLRPIINGSGNYYIESRTRDLRRTDLIVDYQGEQFVIEMKIWYGDEYNRRGKEQLAGYLEDYHLKKGYILSFNFNKNKKIGVTESVCGDKVIIEAVV